MSLHPGVFLFTQSVLRIQPVDSPLALAGAMEKLSTEELWLSAALAHGYYTTPKVSREALIRLVAQQSNLPAFLVRKSCQEAGDHAEALALLLLPLERSHSGFPHELVQWATKTLPFYLRSEESLNRYLLETWPTLSVPEAVFLHKLLLHTMQAPTLAQTLLMALASRVGLDPAQLALHLKYCPQHPPTQSLFLF